MVQNGFNDEKDIIVNDIQQYIFHIHIFRDIADSILYNAAKVEKFIPPFAQPYILRMGRAVGCFFDDFYNSV